MRSCGLDKNMTGEIFIMEFKILINRCGVRSFYLSVKQHQLDIDSFLYKADMEGSSLLHMAVDSGSLQVRLEKSEC